MTVRQAAERLEISLDTVYGLCRLGKIPHERHGAGRGTIRITEAQLAAYRASVTVAGPPPAIASPRARKPAIPDIIGAELAAKAARRASRGL